MTVEQDPKIIGFLTAHGWGEASFFPMTSDASARRYARLLHSGRSGVLMDARDVARTQTEQFCKISDLLRAHGLSAPEIYARDFSSGFLLLEDFGDKVFSRLMDGDPKREDALYRNAIDMLVHLRTLVPPRSLTVASSDVLGLGRLRKQQLMTWGAQVCANAPTYLLHCDKVHLHALDHHP